MYLLQYLDIADYRFQIVFRQSFYLYQLVDICGLNILICISDKDFNIKTGFIFAGMLVLIGLTCYATLNWN